MSHVIRHVEEEHPMPQIPDRMARIRALVRQRPLLALHIVTERPAEPMPVRSLSAKP
jgi:hypothetical protein